jgi:RNA polymerase sigma factor (sigma-70 family)
MSVNRCTFEEIVRENRDKLCGWARSLGVPPEEVEDVVQVVLMKAYDKWPEFEWRSEPGTWLYAFLKRVVSNRRRKASSERRKLDSYAAMPLRRDSDDCDQAFVSHQFQAGLAILDETLRELFVKFVWGYKNRELAEAQDVNINTLASRLHSARLALRRHFDELDTRALLPWWISRWDLVGVGGFCKGLVGTAAIVLAVWVVRPQRDAPIEASNEVPNEATEAASKPRSSVTHDPQPHVPSEAAEPAPPPNPPSAAPRQRKSPMPLEVDYEARFIEVRYYDERIRALGAPHCAVAQLETASHTSGQLSSNSNEGPWMNHVPHVGVLLDSACERMLGPHRVP